MKFIEIRGARQHNLKNINIDIPNEKLVVVTGLSGSGKSSLAFDTIYAEGQRRYVESLSPYSRHFLNLQDKPDVDSINGLSPSIAIDQKSTSKNPRSIVGTITEIYDYLRLLYARVGTPYSPKTGKEISSQSMDDMISNIMTMQCGYVKIFAPIAINKKGEFRKEVLDISKYGFSIFKIDGEYYKFENLPKLENNKEYNISVLVDEFKKSEIDEDRIFSSVRTALKITDGILEVEIFDNHDGKGTNIAKHIFSEKFFCPESNFTIPKIEPRLFSFNSPYGACKSCDGLGNELFFDQDLIVPNEDLSISEGAIQGWTSGMSKYYQSLFFALGEYYDFSIDEPFANIGEEGRAVLFFGTNGKKIEFSYNDGMQNNLVSDEFLGIIPILQKQYMESDSNWLREEMDKFRSIKQCHECGGYRLNQEALSIKIDGFHIGRVCEISIDKLTNWISSVKKKLTNDKLTIAEKIFVEIETRLGYLINIGLGYLTLGREASTLSGGEFQRIRLASQISCGLSGVIYVLDEPSIGLHQSDNDKLILTLKQLRDLGNSVIVVEHDEETMHNADYIIDIGPKAGIHGGYVIAAGSVEEVKQNPESITGQYLSGQKFIPVPKNVRKFTKDDVISIKNASANNLKNVDIDIPLGVFCSVAGVSGGGKSSLVIHTLYKALNRIVNKSKISKPGPYDSILGTGNIDKVIQIDQSPIGRTPRSNPSTYIGAFSLIRELFANLDESKIRGYKSSRFSFNVKGGRCETCQGDGVIKIEMHFLSDIYITCRNCNGLRYNKDTLEIKYKGKSISEILEMTTQEAKSFFKKVPPIYEKFEALNDVGLGYIKIGQNATTLSGGEAQRIKLAKELSKKSTGKTLYILDEPTTGLHSDDIRRLLAVLHLLVNKGNSVIVIEHNLDVIKTSDWIIDVGPKGGDEGGYVVSQGTPEFVMNDPKSVTGIYLKKTVDRDIENAKKNSGGSSHEFAKTG